MRLSMKWHAQCYAGYAPSACRPNMRATVARGVKGTAEEERNGID
jgi:hypothetical protein